MHLPCTYRSWLLALQQHASRSSCQCITTGACIREAHGFGRPRVPCSAFSLSDLRLSTPETVQLRMQASANDLPVCILALPLQLCACVSSHLTTAHFHMPLQTDPSGFPCLAFLLQPFFLSNIMRYGQVLRDHVMLGTVIRFSPLNSSLTPILSFCVCSQHRFPLQRRTLRPLLCDCHAWHCVRHDAPLRQHAQEPCVGRPGHRWPHRRGGARQDHPRGDAWNERGTGLCAWCRCRLSISLQQPFVSDRKLVVRSSQRGDRKWVCRVLRVRMERSMGNSMAKGNSFFCCHCRLMFSFRSS
jgi:hypothetical protein